MARKTFSMKAPVTRGDPSQPKTDWITIGRATELDDGRVICTMEAVPTDWKGVFYLYPKEK